MRTKKQHNGAEEEPTNVASDQDRSDARAGYDCRRCHRSRRAYGDAHWGALPARDVLTEFFRFLPGGSVSGPSCATPLSQIGEVSRIACPNRFSGFASFPRMSPEN